MTLYKTVRLQKVEFSPSSGLDPANLLCVAPTTMAVRHKQVNRPSQDKTSVHDVCFQSAVKYLVLQVHIV